MVKDNKEEKDFTPSFSADLNLFMNQGFSSAVIAFLNKKNLEVQVSGKVSYAYLFSQSITAEFNEGYGGPEYKGEEFPFKDGSLKFNIHEQLTSQCGGLAGLFKLYNGEQKQMFGSLVRTVVYLETLKFLEERTAEAIEIYNNCIK